MSSALFYDVSLNKLRLSLSQSIVKSANGLSQANPRQYTAKNPVGCESLAALMDAAVLESRQDSERYLIVIIRLGRNERTSLAKARFVEINTYLKRYDRIKIVTASGIKSRTSGQIEVYVGGKLRLAVPVEKGSPHICFGKVNPFL